MQLSAIIGHVGAEFDSEHRELLQNEAGALYQKLVLEGSVSADDERIVDGGPEHAFSVQGSSFRHRDLTSLRRMLAYSVHLQCM